MTETQKYIYLCHGNQFPFVGPLSLPHAWKQAEEEYGRGGILTKVLPYPREAIWAVAMEELKGSHHPEEGELGVLFD
ncbi:hypothetical protein COU49_02915 [Candidatus Nomurabacteria bacterium CG10_big_fil_rev_8_21_14_0_10_35_16]|uniref:Uncharacterized protein n=1 Tax=Candidatus Nomurabacteria bacterium CG10_big_fil_rev_8_21_14_0_10_35_16 TaxID=1974731 RepID=A0A2H0TAS2_9BACT|nr:MAG: hypothetical protein COU49_02915 [Candidatus Nomurabacteria bacterium CG10_big_fil_rev_8_21_14_0_10_35_16]